MLLAFVININLVGITTLNKNDPYPLYNSLYPYSYLLKRTQNFLKCITQDDHPELFGVAASVFHQKANRGRDYEKQRRLLGDLEGRWDMLAMTYGPLPIGASLSNTELGRAKVAIWDGSLVPPNNPNGVLPFDLQITDSNCRIGFFEVPLRYRKTGMRFEISVQPFEDFGFTFQSGFAEMKQTLTQFVDLTPTATLYDGFTLALTTSIETFLMNPPQNILTFTGQGLEVCDFRSTSFEDVRLFVWWRHVFEANACNCEWPHFLFIPFVNFETSLPTAKRQERRKAFALPFGNDGHVSLAATAGFHIDFIETVEIGFYGGVTHFLPRNIANFRLPTSIIQSGVFPFSTEVRRKPGRNINYGLLFNAYRFLDKFSFFAEYAVISHGEDTIKLVNPDPAFIPRQQECLSKFSVHLLNTALNYEISPNFTLGVAVQWPLVQRNAYRTTTVLGTIQVTF